MPFRKNDFSVLNLVSDFLVWNCVAFDDCKTHWVISHGMNIFGWYFYGCIFKNDFDFRLLLICSGWQNEQHSTVISWYKRVCIVHLADDDVFS